MSSLLTSSPSIPTLGDLLDRLGGVSAERVRYYPLPGTATEQDVIDIDAREDRLCELVDGVLVEKAMGFIESHIAIIIAQALANFVRPRNLGFVTGEAGMMRLFPATVRIPDVAFVSRERVPGGRLPQDAIPSLAPDLAVEVLSESNTVREMERKLQEYFDAGVRLVWLVDPANRSVRVFTAAGKSNLLREGALLTGGDVLPGFEMGVSSLFAELPELK